MNDLNDTHVDAIHRIYISSSEPTDDRTGLYIVILLCMLVFILLLYLLYNFIAYRRYCSLRNKKKTRTKSRPCSNTNEQSIIRSHELPLHSYQSPLSINQNLSPLTDQYSIQTHLVSDL